MTRLIVQHPTLTGSTVQSFAEVLGEAPVTHLPNLAVWDNVDIGGSQVSELAEQHQVDAQIVRRSDRLGNYRLIAFDMDSTLITCECIDEIADFAGCREQVAAITEATMRGEIANFSESLRQRTALLANLPESTLQTVYDQRIELTDGAEALINAAQQHGLKTLLVSGGFTFFSSRLAQRLQFDWHHANELEIEHGRLTGRIKGPIVDGQEKRRQVLRACEAIGCDPAQAIVVGDGANDLPMMAVAGASIAYHAKPVVRSESTHGLNYSGLSAVLNFFSDTLTQQAG